MKVLWIADSGHEWLKVPLKTCKNLEISSFSYWDGDSAYLEGDCDAAIWLREYPTDATEISEKVIDGEWRGRYEYARFVEKVGA